MKSADEPLGRDDSWLRPKRHGEKWPRFAAEIPPELAEELDALVDKLHGPPNRAEMVRAGLRLYLEFKRPEPEPAIEGTAVDLPDEDLPSETP
jgi:hypothetical protein